MKKIDLEHLLADVLGKWCAAVWCLVWKANHGPCSEGSLSHASGLFSWSNFPQKVIKYVHALIRDKCQSTRYFHGPDKSQQALMNL